MHCMLFYIVHTTNLLFHLILLVQTYTSFWAPPKMDYIDNVFTKNIWSLSSTWYSWHGGVIKMISACIFNMDNLHSNYLNEVYNLLFIKNLQILFKLTTPILSWP